MLKQHNRISTGHLKGYRQLRGTLAILLVLLLAAMGSAQAAPPATAAIYLSGASGNDANDGSTAALAVKSFARARELAVQNQNIGSILVTGTVPVSGTLTLAGTNAVLKRDPAFLSGYLLRVLAGQGATLQDITLDGNAQQAVGTTRALIHCAGTLNIQAGAVLENNQAGHPTGRSNGGAIECSAGTVNMSGGIIQNNSATIGGGILLKGRSVLNMSGGVIRDNRALNGRDMAAYNDAGSGGGICLYDGGIANLSEDARVLNNFAEEVGGGVSVGTLEASILGDTRLVMTGGLIDGNSSGATGGGIFVQASYRNLVSSATITAGSITNNHMLGTGKTRFSFGGGGIYVNGVRAANFNNGQLFLRNVVITDNEATRQGGGYAACPISETRIYLTDGAAIYGNRAESAKEVYLYSDTRSAIWGGHAGNPVYSVSSTMLGGVPYNWQYPDGTEVPLNQLSGVLLGDGTDLSMHTTAVGDDLTRALAKVWITGNTSVTRGGGIGSNGDVTLGTADEQTQIEVSKTWTDDNNKQGRRPGLVQVELWRRIRGSNDAPVYVGYETIQPDPSTGDWRLTILNLPLHVPGSPGRIFEHSIRERPVAGYLPTISGDQTEGFVVNNGLAHLQVPLRAQKVLKGGVLKAGEFQFGLRDATGKLIATAHNEADGSVVFPDRSFSQVVSNYWYTVEELPGNAQDMVYDKTVYTLRVDTRMVEGQLVASLRYEKDGTPYQGPLLFTNTRKAPSTGDSALRLPLLLLAVALASGLAAAVISLKKREPEEY